MSASKGGSAPYSAHRSKLQPRLVHLIAGLRPHQVEEAVDLLLDYIDQASSRQPHLASAANAASPPESVMPMALCEAKKLVLHPGQPYVFLPDDECESCRSALASAVNSYGLTAVTEWLTAGKALFEVQDAHGGQTP